MSDEAQPTEGASEADPTAGSGSGAAGEGGAGGTQPQPDGGDAFAAERDSLQSTIRTLQSERDKAKAELARLSAAPAPSGGDNAEPKPATADEVLALIERRDALRDAASSLKTEFPLADPSLFTKAASYDSPEALRVAAEESHNAKKAEKDALRAEVEAEVRAAYVEKYGELPAAPKDGNGGNGDGLPSAAEVAGWSFSQIDAFIAEHGEEAWSRIVRSS